MKKKQLRKNIALIASLEHFLCHLVAICFLLCQFLKRVVLLNEEEESQTKANVASSFKRKFT